MEEHENEDISRLHELYDKIVAYLEIYSLLKCFT